MILVVIMTMCTGHTGALSPLCHICHSRGFCNFIPLLFVDHLPTIADKRPTVRVTRTLSFPLQFAGDRGDTMKLQTLGRLNMKFLKLALLGTAALAAASVSARADSLDSLKAAMDNLNIGAVADAPAAAAPATSVVWNGFVRAGVTTAYNPTATGVGAAGQYYTDIRTYGEIKVTAKTETAVGEVGVDYQLQASGGIQDQIVGNGSIGPVSTDGIHGWWKMTPNLTLAGGTEGTLAKSSYSWDANATSWWSASTGGGVFGGIPKGDPAAIQLAYADGPLSFAAQVEDANNWNNSSAFGVTAKVGYKMDAIGFDLEGGYWGNAGPLVAGTTGAAAWSVGGGAGYSAGAFSIGAAIADAQIYDTGAAYVPGSIYAKVNMSDVAHIEMGATHDFSTGQATSGMTTFGGGLYYTPVKQLAFGAEAGYVSGGASNGSYTASLISQFMF